MSEPTRHCPNPDCPDLVEMGEAGEYRAETADCPVCGTPLAAGPPPAEAPDAHEGEDLIPVLEVHNAALLPVAKSLLDSAGIAFAVRNEEVQGLVGWGQIGTGFNPLTGPPEIAVGEHDVEEARALLEELQRSESSEEE